jgi:hypothetical protein
VLVLAALALFIAIERFVPAPALGAWSIHGSALILDRQAAPDCEVDGRRRGALQTDVARGRA